MLRAATRPLLTPVSEAARFHGDLGAPPPATPIERRIRTWEGIDMKLKLVALVVLVAVGVGALAVHVRRGGRERRRPARST